MERKELEQGIAIAAAFSKDLSLPMKSREAVIASTMETMEIAWKALEQVEQCHAEVLKNLNEMESDQQKAQEELFAHYDSMESLCLELLT